MDKQAVEKKNRMQVALWAYAYEVKDNPFVDDATFDKKCLEIDTSILTGNDVLDTWFKENFDPSTGSWVYSHPEFDKLADIYDSIRLYGDT